MDAGSAGSAAAGGPDLISISIWVQMCYRPCFIRHQLLMSFYSLRPFIRFLYPSLISSSKHNLLFLISDFIILPSHLQFSFPRSSSLVSLTVVSIFSSSCSGRYNVPTNQRAPERTTTVPKHNLSVA